MSPERESEVLARRRNPPAAVERLGRRLSPTPGLTGPTAAQVGGSPSVRPCTRRAALFCPLISLNLNKSRFQPTQGGRGEQSRAPRGEGALAPARDRAPRAPSPHLLRGPHTAQPHRCSRPRPPQA